MIKLTEKSRKILRAIYRGIGTATVVLSIGACPFMACMYGPEPDAKMYGMPPDEREDVRIQGQVKNKATGDPIIGIAVYMQNVNYHTTTGYNGYFAFYVPKKNGIYKLIFTDIDGEANGGRFKQREIELTQDEVDALKDNPLIIELEEDK